MQPSPLPAFCLALLLAACIDPADEDSGVVTDADADGWSIDQGDCDDSSATSFPGAAELCNGIDDDCDQIVDEDAVDAPSWFVDADGDGFGDDDNLVGCTAPAGSSASGGDCDDGDNTVFPGAAERCNDQDDDCDDDVDEEAVDATDWYVDADGDGFGVSETVAACSLPDGASDVLGDCDDDNDAVNPAAEELCSGEDNDCNGRIDDAGCALSLQDLAWAWEERALGEYWVRDLVIGDATGDGVADLLLGQPASPALYGRVEVLPGPLGEGVDPVEHVALIGTSGDQGGYALALDDIDGDGIADLLASAPTATGGTGSVYLYLGPFDASSPVVDGSWSGTDVGDQLGQWVLELGAGPGDGLRASIRDDGLADMLVGSHGSSAVQPGGGLLTVLPATGIGSLAAAPLQIVPDEADEGLGYAAAAPADADGDGVADLFCGSLGIDAAHLILGPISGVVSTADDDLRLSGDAGSSLGSATRLGDVDGDGSLELIVGARSRPSSASSDDDAGALYVFDVVSPGQLGPDDSFLRIDGPAGSLLGGPDADLALSDIDGDGADDLLLASPYAGGGGSAWLLYGSPGLAGSGDADAIADHSLPAVADSGELGAAVGIGDLDGDGIPELVLAGASSPQLFILPGTVLVAVP